MLAGCGNSAEQTANTNETAATTDAVSETGQGTANASGQATTGDAAQSNAQTPERTADLMGKIVSVTADSIVVLKSKMQPADMPQGGGQGGGPGGGQPPTDGTAPQGEAPADGESPEMPAGQDGQTRPEGGRGGGGGFGQMEYTEEQVTVKLSSESAIFSMSFNRESQSAATSQLTTSDLKADDIVTIWLNPDGETAQTVQLRTMPNGNGEAGDKQ